MSSNASDHQVRRAITLVFVKRVSQLVNSGTSVRDAVAQVFGKYKDLIDRSIFDKDSSAKTDQVDLLLLLQSELAHRESGDVILVNAATKLVELDVLEDDGVLQWWDNEKSSDGEDLEKVREKTRQLVDVLNQSSEEESDDDDDEGDDSE